MAQGFVVGGGGGGVGSDELTATAGDVLTGLKYVGKDTNDDVGTGTLALSGNAAVGDVASGKTFYSNNAKSKLTGTLALSGNAAVGNVLSGKTFYATSLTSKLTGTMTNQGSKSFTVDRRGSVIIPAGYYDGTGKITGPSMTDKGATTYYATTSDQTIIPAGYYTTGAQTLKKLTNTNLAAGNIKTGVTISVHNGNANVWSVAGTYKGLGNAVQADVKSGKTFSTTSLSNVSGTMPAYAGQTVTPSASSQTLSISGKYNTGNVIVSAIPSSYVQSGGTNNFFKQAALGRYGLSGRAAAFSVACPAFNKSSYDISNMYANTNYADPNRYDDDGSIFFYSRVPFLTQSLVNRTISIRIRASLFNTYTSTNGPYWQVWAAGVVFPTRSEVTAGRWNSYDRYKVPDITKIFGFEVDKYSHPEVIYSMDYTDSFRVDADPRSDGSDRPYGFFYVYLAGELWDSTTFVTYNIQEVTITIS